MQFPPESESSAKETVILAPAKITPSQASELAEGVDGVPASRQAPRDDTELMLTPCVRPENEESGTTSASDHVTTTLQPGNGGKTGLMPSEPTTLRQESVHGRESVVFDDIYVTDTGSSGSRRSTPPSSSRGRTSEKYEVNVRKYADYATGENGSDSDVYAEEARARLKYASKNPFARFASDLVCILARPAHFWDGQDNHPATITQVCFPHLTILILLRATLSFIGNILQKDAPVMPALLNALFQVFLILVFVWGLSFCYAFAMIRSRHTFDMVKAFRFVSYSITPILFIGVVAVIPIPHVAVICDVLAMPYAFVVMGAGMLPYLHLDEKTAPTLTGFFCGLMACFWAMLPMLLPYLTMYFNS